MAQPNQSPDEQEGLSQRWPKQNAGTRVYFAQQSTQYSYSANCVMNDDNITASLPPISPLNATLPLIDTGFNREAFQPLQVVTDTMMRNFEGMQLSQVPQLAPISIQTIPQQNVFGYVDSQGVPRAEPIQLPTIPNKMSAPSRIEESHTGDSGSSSEESESQDEDSDWKQRRAVKTDYAHEMEQGRSRGEMQRLKDELKRSEKEKKRTHRRLKQLCDENDRIYNDRLVDQQRHHELIQTLQSKPNKTMEPLDQPVEAIANEEESKRSAVTSVIQTVPPEAFRNLIREELSSVAKRSDINDAARALERHLAHKEIRRQEHNNEAIQPYPKLLNSLSRIEAVQDQAAKTGLNNVMAKTRTASIKPEKGQTKTRVSVNAGKDSIAVLKKQDTSSDRNKMSKPLTEKSLSLLSNGPSIPRRALGDDSCNKITLLPADSASSVGAKRRSKKSTKTRFLPSHSTERLLWPNEELINAKTLPADFPDTASQLSDYQEATGWDPQEPVLLHSGRRRKSSSKGNTH